MDKRAESQPLAAATSSSNDARHRDRQLIDRQRDRQLIDRQRDRQLIDRVLRGDDRAFDELVYAHQKPIYYTALRYVKNQDDAADITQKTFVRAYRSLSKFRGDSALGSWLVRIAINLSLNHLRDRSRVQATDISDLADMGEEALTTHPTGPNRVIRDQEKAALLVAVESLPDKQRMVLSLRVFEELSFREIARLVDSSENAAKVNFHHAVKKLRTIMNQDKETLR